MIFGKKQTLVMIKRVEFGIYLAETMKDAENKVLLPKNRFRQIWKWEIRSMCFIQGFQ